MEGHDGHHGHVRVGQGLGGWSASHDAAPSVGRGIAAMPQLPNGVELQPAPTLLGVDHEHSTGADHQVIKVGCRAGDGQVVQDRPLVSTAMLEGAVAVSVITASERPRTCPVN
jgi:hypothetical protein